MECNYATHTGVYARDIIPQRTCFGPMVGQHCSNVDLSNWPEKDTPQIWKVGRVYWFYCWLSMSGVGNHHMQVELFFIPGIPQQRARILHCDCR